MSDPTFISLFSGIGGADLGFERAGFECVAQVECHPWRRKVLAHHWPDVPRFDDVCEVGAHNLPRADVIVGGFPCQDLSVAGKRRGLAGKRSGLFYEFSRIIDELSPAWFCIENVPGLLSSDPCPRQRGGDFGLVLLELTGYPPDIPKNGWKNSGVCSGPKRTVAWRVLDSRYFGVAQRRRRVFVVGGPGVSSGLKVLFESEGSTGNSQTDEAEGQEVAYALTRRFASDRPESGAATLVAGTLDSGHGAKRFSNQWIDPNKNFLLTGTLTEGRAGVGYASRDSEDKFLICHENIGGNLAEADHSRALRRGASHSYQFLRTSSDPNGMRETTGVPRRVDLPVSEESREVCTCPDTPRYASLGDAMTVNVMEWIARRIRSVMDGTD